MSFADMMAIERGEREKIKGKSGKPFFLAALTFTFDP
jgi:hypothetical protein